MTPEMSLEPHVSSHLICCASALPPTPPPSPASLGVIFISPFHWPPMFSHQQVQRAVPTESPQFCLLLPPPLLCCHHFTGLQGFPFLDMVHSALAGLEPKRPCHRNTNSKSLHYLVSKIQVLPGLLHRDTTLARLSLLKDKICPLELF